MSVSVDDVASAVYTGVRIDGDGRLYARENGENGVTYVADASGFDMFSAVAPGVFAIYLHNTLGRYWVAPGAGLCDSDLANAAAYKNSMEHVREWCARVRLRSARKGSTDCLSSRRWFRQHASRVCY